MTVQTTRLPRGAAGAQAPWALSQMLPSRLGAGSTPACTPFGGHSLAWP